MLVWLGLIAVLAVVAAVAAVAVGPWATTTSRTRSDLEEVLDLSSEPADMVATYHYVEDHPAIVRKIPCYCGCGKALGHMNLLDCFVVSRGVYSSHASGCMVCGSEANNVQRLAAEGKSVREIRNWIDGEYSKYGAGTDTLN